jgi:hypothetical protein
VAERPNHRRADVQEAELPIHAEFFEPPADDPKSRAASGSGPAPLFAGLYVGEDPERSGGAVFHYYLRFSPPNLVSCVTSSGTTQQVSRWFGPQHPLVGHGIFELVGDGITFAATSKAGTVEYSGHVSADSRALALDSHSLINGHRTHRRYHFAETDFGR